MLEGKELWKAIPVGYRVHMVKRAMLQENDKYKAIEAFKEDPYADKRQGGFDWVDSPEGDIFWTDLLDLIRHGVDRKRGVEMWCSDRVMLQENFEQADNTYEEIEI